jgi:hypothetical protein
VQSAPNPADKNVCATWRRLSSLRVLGTFQFPVEKQGTLTNQSDTRLILQLLRL